MDLMITLNGKEKEMTVESDWIDVNDRLPKPKTFCLVFTGSRIDICYFTPKSVFALTVLYGTPVTHWMELPDHPEPKKAAH